MYPNAPTSPAPGHIVGGRYRIERLLGEGGMGTVFLARDLRLDIEVALKHVRADIVCPETRRRLLAEARAAARVSHPSAVRVLDVIVGDHESPFLVMELLRGRPLSDALLDGLFPPETAVRLMLPIIAAVAEAHAHGVVHRDIKPDNILLAPQEGAVPKLVDFGVAKVAGAPMPRRMTPSGTLIGSPEYMAPEQADGRPDVDARADIWALCIVLYELITGVTPFNGTSALDTLTRIRCDDPEPRGLLRTEHELWWLLTRGLAKDRDDRLASAAALGRALARWARARGINSDAAGTAISHWLSH
ncbi:MAG: serine/threonine-protein kinase [Polyangiaceae bacterium]